MVEFYGEKNVSDEEWDLEKSRTQVKKELLAIKELGRKLIDLPATELDKITLDDDVRDAIIEARRLTKSALKRQVGFLGRLLENSDHEQIESDLFKLKQAHQGAVQQFHQLEKWRDELLAGENDIYQVLMNQFDGFDTQHVRQLVRNANKEASQNKPPKYARQLFQYLQSLGH